MNAFTKRDVETLRDKLTKHLDAFAQEHGVSVKVGRIGWDPQMAKVTVELGPEGGTAFPAERAAWATYSYCRQQVDKVSDHALDAQFMDQRGKTFTVVGYAAKRRKSPIVTTCQQDGKTYYFPVALFLHNAPQFRRGDCVLTPAVTR